VGIEEVDPGVLLVEDDERQLVIVLRVVVAGMDNPIRDMFGLGREALRCEVGFLGGRSVCRQRQETSGQQARGYPCDFP